MSEPASVSGKRCSYFDRKTEGTIFETHPFDRGSRNWGIRPLPSSVKGRPSHSQIIRSPTNAGARAASYSIPVTACFTPESIAHTCTPSGSCTNGMGVQGWHKSGRQYSLSPSTEAAWSIIPQADSAITFSTHWHACANSIPARSMPYAALADFMTATSTAAEELTPLFNGTSDSRYMLAPVVTRSG